MTERRFWVYILIINSKTPDIGVTNDLEHRMFEHKNKLLPGFTAQYNISNLVYYAESHDPREAITYEKQIKGKFRAKKFGLVEAGNPKWLDLATDWFN